MRTPSALAALVVVLAVACQADEPPRYVSAEHHFSMSELDGWTVKNRRGSEVFTASDADGVQRNTIAVRSIALEGDWVMPRTAEMLTQSTAAVVRGMPGARIEGAEPITHTTMRSIAFDLTFEPPSRPGQRYERRHVLLVGKRRAYHVMHTAPEGEIFRTAAVFDDVVSSFREEV